MLCSYVTTDKSSLNKHIKIHQKNELEFQCDNCEEVYSSKDDKLRLRKSVHSPINIYSSKDDKSRLRKSVHSPINI